ncbi:MAG: CHAT domain-containing protein, partial [Synechocystis sp.]
MKIIAGDFTTGFTVAFEVERWGQGGNRVCQKDVYGRLPAFSGFSESTATSPLGLDQLYGRWVGGITAARAGYAQRQRGLKIKSKQAIAARYEPLLDRQHQKALKQAMAQWLTTPTPEWQAIEKQLIRWLHSTPVETHVIIQLSQELYRESSQTADILAKLPWPEWPLFSEFQSPGNHPVYFAVNTYQYGAPSSLSLSRPSPQRSLRQSLSPRIRILHVMGHDDGINLEPDQAVLAQLTQTRPKGWYPFIDKPHADVVSLRQPSYEILSQTLKDKRGFDLFVYSGHSEAFYDQDLAAMLLAEKDGVTIADLQLAFQRAIAAGLKIAIFNSCASSQLAEVLLDYGISTVISMKEEVPDTVAHRFLACFFQGYVQEGRSVLSSVKESLTALEEFERLYPGVGWLPIIHQNPALPPPLWRELRQKPQSLRYLGTVAAGAIILGLGLRF